MSTVRDLDGVQALSDAVAAVGLGVEVGAVDGAVDLILRNPAGGLGSVEVKRVSLASVDGLQRRLADWSKRLPPETTGVVVADRVTADARDVLNAAGWGWLDPARSSALGRSRDFRRYRPACAWPVDGSL